MAAILVFQDNETTAMLVSQTNPVGDELFFYVNTSFVPKDLHGFWSQIKMLYTLSHGKCNKEIDLGIYCSMGDFQTIGLRSS